MLSHGYGLCVPRAIHLQTSQTAELAGDSVGCLATSPRPLANHIHSTTLLIQWTSENIRRYNTGRTKYFLPTDLPALQMLDFLGPLLLNPP